MKVRTATDRYIDRFRVTDRFRERVRAGDSENISESEWPSVSLVTAEMREVSSPLPLNGG